MDATKPLYKTALASCIMYPKNAAIQILNLDYDNIKARSDWDVISKFIYEFNKETIDEKHKIEFSAWQDGNFTIAGTNAA